MNRLLSLLYLMSGALLLLLLPTCQLAQSIRHPRYHRDTATAITGADVIGGTEIDTGRYVLLAYETYSNVRHVSDSWYARSVFIKLKSLQELPLGQAVSVPDVSIKVSAYGRSTWHFEHMQQIKGTVTRLESTSTGHRLLLNLHYSDRKGISQVLARQKVVFQAAPDYFQKHRVDHRGKYEDLRLALKEPGKVRALDLVNYAIQYKKRNGRDSGPDTLYRRLGELHNLEELDLHLSDLKSLPESMRNLKRLKKLNLGYNDLAEFPALLFELDSLQELNLEWNQLDSIPTRVAQFQQLKKLNLGNNRLDHYPMAVNAVTSLRALGLANANLRSVPIQIQQLVNLKILSLDGFWNAKRRNQLLDITALNALGKLRSLSLKDNGTIEVLEQQLYQLHKLRKLEELNLEWNTGASQLDSTRLPELKSLEF